MFKRIATILSLLFVAGIVFAGNQYLGQKSEYITSYTDFTGNELTTAEWVNGVISGSIADQTFQDVVDNSIAQDGEVFVEYGASLFEDDGGSSSSQIKIGGYEWEIRDQAADTTIVVRAPTTYSSEDGYMEFVDNRANAVGLQYRDDYCATLTGNSLIHKSCVEGLITGAALKSGNLVTIDGNNEIDLGGTATTTATLDMDGNDFYIQNAGDIILQSEDGTTLDIYDGAFDFTLPGGVGYTADGNGITYSHLFTSTDPRRVPTLNYITGLINNATSLSSVLGVGNNTDGHNIFVEEGDKIWFGDDTSAGGQSIEGEAGGDITINAGDGQFNFASTNYEWNGDTFIDHSNTTMKYGADYSGHYVDRSFVDKGYVDGEITSATLKSGNLITINSNNEIDLGGTATDDVSLGGNGGEMEIRDWGHIFTDDVNDIDINATNGVNINNGANSINFGSNGISVVTDNTKKLELTSNSAGRAFDIDARDVETVSLATTGDGKVTFTNSGWTYDQDYSGYNTSNNRRLADKGYVDGEISSTTLKSGNLITINSNNEIDLGGTATDDVEIDGGGNILEMYNLDELDVSAGYIYLDGNGVTLADQNNYLTFDNGVKFSIDHTDDLLFVSSNPAYKYDVTWNQVGTWLATGADSFEFNTESGAKLTLTDAVEVEGKAQYSNTGDMGTNDEAFASKYYVDNSISAIPVTNIYTANGILTGDRTVNGSGNTMTLTNTYKTILDSNNDTSINAGRNVALSASSQIRNNVGSSYSIMGDGFSNVENNLFSYGISTNEFYMGDIVWNNGFKLSTSDYVFNIKGTGGVNVESSVKVDMQVPSIGSNQRVLLMSGVGAIGNTDVNFQARDSYGALMNGGDYGAYVGYGFSGAPLILTKDVYIGANTGVHIDAPVTNMTGDVIFRDELKLTKTASGAVWQTLSGSTWVDFKTREF